MARLTRRERQALHLLHDPLPIGSLPCVACGAQTTTTLRDVAGEAVRLCTNCAGEHPPYTRSRA